jgi:hypothetical protein
MAQYFTEPRNIELSTLDYLETKLNASWSGVTIVKTFKKAYARNTSLPIVCVRLANTSSKRLEIGSNTLTNAHLIIIDIFATSDAQRIDLAYFIKDVLKDGFTYYIFSHVSGDKSKLSKVADGRVYVSDFVNDTKIDVGETVDEKDKYRHVISVRLRKSV